MRLSDFDFDLPEEAIARYPTERRDESRLLVVDRRDRSIRHHRFRDLPGLLDPGDLVVANDTKVLKGRLYTRKVGTGGRVELLLVEPAREHGQNHWRAMATPAKSLRPRQTLEVEGAAAPLEVVERTEEGAFVVVRLPWDAETFTEAHGALPLPPYVRRASEPVDDERYQTVFARPDARESVAAPTAGLHFTPELLAALEARGVGCDTLTLHVGPGTFLPVRTDDPDEHVMHHERYVLTPETAARIEATRSSGKRAVAVGTTVTRVLETRGAPVTPASGSTDLFIRPGFDFRVVDALVTNFHLPRSTLIMLVCAFADRELILDAYRVAVEEGYRFYSYGDAMLVL